MDDEAKLRFRQQSNKYVEEDVVRVLVIVIVTLRHAKTHISTQVVRWLSILYFMGAK